MNNSWLSLKLLVIFSLLSSKSYGIILLSDSQRDFQIPSSDMQIFQDKDGRMDFDLIRSIQPSAFSNVSGQLPVENSTHYWVRFILKDSTQIKNWFLQFPLHSNKIDIYFLDTDQHILKEYHTGQSLYFHTRPIDARTFLFEIPFHKNNPLIVYAHLFNEKHSDLSIIISQKHNYFEVHTKSYLFLGLTYGILFLMMLYNLVLYISIKERIYLYYVLYVLSSILFLTWKDGIAFQFLWPGVPFLNQYHHAIALFFLIVTFLFYTKEFLAIDKVIPNGNKIFLISLSILLFHLCISLFDKSYFEPLPWIYLLNYLIILSFSIYLYWFKDFKISAYIILSVTCFLIAFITIKLRYVDLIEWNWFNEYILNYVVIAEGIIMSLAIKDRIIFLKDKEKEAKENFIKKEKLIVENEIIQMKNRGLEWELKNQNNELATLSEFLNQKTEFLEYLKKELEGISSNQDIAVTIKKLVREISREVELENHWEQFQLNFDKANDNLLSRLKAAHPSLKPADTLLCAYIKLGKSNKEIAGILNISISGVEKRRVRLKEKLDLESEVKLTEFINNF